MELKGEQFGLLSHGSMFTATAGLRARLDLLKLLVLVASTPDCSMYYWSLTRTNVCLELHIWFLTTHRRGVPLGLSFRLIVDHREVGRKSAHDVLRRKCYILSRNIITDLKLMSGLFGNRMLH